MTEKIYPILNDDPHAFRLQRISEIDNTLRRDIEKRKSTRKKYDRVVAATEGIDATLMTGSILAAGIGFAVPVLLPLQIVALVTGSCAAALKFVRHFLTKKSDKHAKIIGVAQCKLNSVQDIVSKALEDGKISDEEFAHVSHELTKYREMTLTIRKRVREEKKKAENDDGFKNRLDELLKNWKEGQR